MNNKGFSLIELIIAIAILALIALISTPSIIEILEKNKKDNYNSTIDSIVEAAELYTSDNRYNLSFKDKSGNDSFCKPSDTNELYASVTLQTLIDRGNISSPVKNFCTDNDINNSTVIKIILDCKTRQFSYDIYENTSYNTLKRKSSTPGLEGLKLENNCKDLYLE